MSMEGDLHRGAYASRPLASNSHPRGWASVGHDPAASLAPVELSGGSLERRKADPVEGAAEGYASHPQVGAAQGADGPNAQEDAGGHSDEAPWSSRGDCQGSRFSGLRRDVHERTRAPRGRRHDPALSPRGDALRGAAWSAFE